MSREATRPRAAQARPRNAVVVLLDSLRLGLA